MPEVAVETNAVAQPTFLNYLTRDRGAGEPAVDKRETKVETPAADASAPAKPADGSDPSNKPNKVEVRKNEIQKEIDAQVARREAARRDADAEEERLKKLRTPEVPRETPAPVAAPKQATADGTDPNDPKPDEAKYADWASYQADLTKWLARTEFRRFKAEESQKQIAETQRQAQEASAKSHKDAVSDFEARGSEYSNEHEDYPELVQKFKETKISPELEAVILWGFEGSEGPEFLHDLLKEPDKLSEIEKMSTPIKRFSALFNFRAQKKIAALEARVAELEASPAQPKRSQAPPTGTRVSGAAGGGGSKDPANFQQFMKKKFGT